MAIVMQQDSTGVPLDMSDLMHIGRLADLAGTTTRTVRYYEEMGLIHPESRSPGGFRRYTDDQLKRLSMILSLKRFEFDLEHIKRILERRDGDGTGGRLASDMLADLRGRLEEVERQIGHLSSLKGELRQTMETLCSCEPCENRLAERPCSDCKTIGQGRGTLAFFHELPVG